MNIVNTSCLLCWARQMCSCFDRSTCQSLCRSKTLKFILVVTHCHTHAITFIYVHIYVCMYMLHIYYVLVGYVIMQCDGNTIIMGNNYILIMTMNVA